MNKIFIANPKYIFINGKIEIGLAIAFNKNILAIDQFEILNNIYPDAEILSLKNNSLLMAGFINSHVHLEYNNIIGEYKYGSYINWLQTVFDSFKYLNVSINKQSIQNGIKSLLQSGTTTIGAISSRGLDLELLAESPIRKIIFNEIIGSQTGAIEWATYDLEQRINKSESLKSDKFIPAIAIHSPFSVHSILQNRAIEIAKSRNYLISTHFLESREEREWLDHETGELKNFYLKNYGRANRFVNSFEFLSQFDGLKTIFAHGSYLTEQELNLFQNQDWTVSHSPVSNRLLDGKILDINLLNKFNIDWILSTDGMSSNFSINQIDEMRSAIFSHYHKQLNNFAVELILASTSIPAKALNLNSGEIAIGRDSDLIFFEIDNSIKIEDIIVHIILRGYKPYLMFILGNKVDL